MGLVAVSPAHAGYIVTLEQVGSDVVASGSGEIDTTGLQFLFTGGAGSNIWPAHAIINTGLADDQADLYTGSFAGPTNFGSGGQTFVTSGAGDFVGLQDGAGVELLIVPAGYGQFFDG
jgi:hypothetical protein